MPFIPHTQTEIECMLDEIGLPSTQALFDEIPQDLLIPGVALPGRALTEAELAAELQTRAHQDECKLSFLGAGAYEHYIPGAVWDIVGRGEFLTSYTPYQAEASQGTLQLLYEFQTMMANLTGMEVSNASLYDGATAVAEAILMTVRIKKGPRKILIPQTLSPFYRQVVATIVSQQHIEVVNIPYSPETGYTDLKALVHLDLNDVAAMVIVQPNFFGVLEPIDELTEWAHAHQLLAIGVVNPLSLGLLKDPGHWGEQGADIVCGEGQPLGIPISSGGPYFGFMCTRKMFVRQMPGRIIGRTQDKRGKTGYVLTLQAREQHIRRSKATSNICTNQGLMVTAATIYMALVGPEGLKRIAALCHQRTRELVKRIASHHITPKFQSAYFHECLLQLSSPIKDVVEMCLSQGVQPGFDPTPYYPELKNCLLMCATETKTADQIEGFCKTIDYTHCT